MLLAKHQLTGTSRSVHDRPCTASLASPLILWRPSSSVAKFSKCLSLELACRHHGRAPLLQVTAATLTAAPASTVSQAAISWTDLESTQLPSTQPVLVLFTSTDLRVDDHPGLAAAVRSGASSVVPVFVFDPDELSHLLYTPAGPEVLLAAVSRLQRDLQALGSDLVVRVGSSASAAATAATACSAGALVAKHQVENWRSEHLTGVAQAVAGASSGTGSYCWGRGDGLWPDSTFRDNFRTWSEQRGMASQPVPAPTTLPPIPSGIDRGSIPGSAELREMLTKAALQQISSADSSGRVRQVSEVIWAECAAPSNVKHRRAMRMSAAVAEHGVLPLLQAYLRLPSIQPTSPFYFLVEEERCLKTPAAAGASFNGLFGQLLSMGVLSVRRVHSEARRQSRASLMGGTSLPPEAKAALVAAEGAEFHRLLAAHNEGRPIEKGVSVRHWRWRGALTDFLVCEPSDDARRPDAPAVLLLHGFGAFGDQWRDNVKQLAEAGFRVYAPTMPGFGRSEKVSVQYSQTTWSEFLRDFVLQVVRSPTVIAGNSIGGFIACNMAADHKDLVSGLVLLNSAGPIDANYDPIKYQASVLAKKPPPAWVAQGLTSGLFAYLERTIPGTLKWLYPTAPHRADDWLAAEIFRAACDQGSTEVFKAAFYLPPPRALNHLVSEVFKGPTLVLQGVLDPLNGAKKRAEQMQQLCSNVKVQLINAGHCPHDEQPALVNGKLLEWMSETVLPAHQTNGNSAAATAAQ